MMIGRIFRRKLINNMRRNWRKSVTRLWLNWNNSRLNIKLFWKRLNIWLIIVELKMRKKNFCMKSNSQPPRESLSQIEIDSSSSRKIMNIKNLFSSRTLLKDHKGHRSLESLSQLLKSKLCNLLHQRDMLSSQFTSSLYRWYHSSNTSHHNNQ